MGGFRFRISPPPLVESAFSEDPPHPPFFLQSILTHCCEVLREQCVAAYPTRKVLLVVKWYAKYSIKIQKLIEILIIENFQKSVYFLFESGSLDSPGGPSSNRRYSITGVLPSDGNYVCGPGRPFRSQNTDYRPTHTLYSATIR